MTLKNIAIIGATGTAYKRTIPALKGSDFCRVSAIQGRNAEKLKRVQTEFHIPESYTSVDELLTNASYDLIFIGTPPFLHYENILSSVKTKKPIICEKPLAVSYEEGKKIADLLRDYDTNNFAVAHHLRHQKAIVDIKSHIENGAIGEVVSAYIQWGFEMNLSAPNALWKMKAELGGKGTFSDNGVHIIDLALHLFGEPDSIYGIARNIRLAETFDDETAVLVYPNKMCVQLHSSQSAKFSGNHLLIYGTSGSIEAFNAIGEKSISHVQIKSNAVTLDLDYPVTNLYGNEVEDFAKRLSGKKSINIPTNLSDALNSLAIMDKIRESSLLNIPVRLRSESEETSQQEEAS